MLEGIYTTHTSNGTAPSTSNSSASGGSNSHPSPCMHQQSYCLVSNVPSGMHSVALRRIALDHVTLR